MFLEARIYFVFVRISFVFVQEIMRKTYNSLLQKSVLWHSFPKAYYDITSCHFVNFDSEKSPWRWNFWTTRCITYLLRIIQRLWILKILWHETGTLTAGSSTTTRCMLRPFIKCKYRDFFCVHSVSEKSPSSYHYLSLSSVLWISNDMCEGI